MISNIFVSAKQVNVILHTLNCKIDTYRYCCEDKVRTTGVTPVLKGSIYEND